MTLGTYADADGSDFALVPHSSSCGDRACIGCALTTWTGAGGGPVCRAAPSCTTDGIKGRHVWKLTKHWQDKETA